MRKRPILLPGKLELAVLLTVLIVSLIPPVQAALLSSYGDPCTTGDYVEVLDFEITGPKPLKAGDMVTVSFTLNNTGDSIQFGNNGVFVATIDPGGRRRDFGYAYEADTLEEGERINFKASMTVDMDGEWIFSPVYSTRYKDAVYAGYRLKSEYANPEIGDYFAVEYSGERCMAINGKPNVLSPIIREFGKSDKKSLATGQSLDIGNGYSIVPMQIDLEGDKVWLVLVKDGKEVESEVIDISSSGGARFANRMRIYGSPGAYSVVTDDVSATRTFVYQTSVGLEKNVPIFSMYVDAVFRGTYSNIMQLKYAILIDDNLIETDADPDDLFRTTIIAEKRNPPDTPDKPSGALSGQTGTSYTYRTSATDMDDDRIAYTFDWDDGTSTTTDYTDSGFSVSTSHSWVDPGTYSVKVKAVDGEKMESGWSDRLTVTITSPDEVGGKEIEGEETGGELLVREGSDRQTVTITNTQPGTPDQPSGVSSGQTGTSYIYRTSATDPDDDQIKYIFDWGDGVQNQTDYTDSDFSVSASHSWADPGTYTVRIKAVDSEGMESGWSDRLTVIITNDTRFVSDPLGLGGEEQEGQEEELVRIIGVVLVIAGLLFTALTTVKRDVTIEFGVSERTIKYVGGTGIILIAIGAYMLLKSAGLI
jgi:hypothetical protein